VVATKTHYDSYIADMPEAEAKDFFWAVTRVAKLLDKKLDDVGRTGIVFEGMGVNHVHAKLFPMHGTADIVKEWRQFNKPDINTYFKKYEGYISSHSSHERAAEEELAKLAKLIRE